MTMTLGVEVGCNLVLGRPFVQGEGAKIRHRPRIGSARTVAVVLVVIVAVTGHGCWLLWRACKSAKCQVQSGAVAGDYDQIRGGSKIRGRDEREKAFRSFVGVKMMRRSPLRRRPVQQKIL